MKWPCKRSGNGERQRWRGENYESAKKTNGLSVHFMCTSCAPLSWPPSPFSELCHGSTAGREWLYRVGLYGKKDMWSLEVGPWVSLTHSWLHGSCFSEIRHVSCDVWLPLDKLSFWILVSLLVTLTRGEKAKLTELSMFYCPTYSIFTSQRPMNAWTDCSKSP